MNNKKAPDLFGAFLLVWGVCTLAPDMKEIMIQRMTENLPVLRKKLKLSQEKLANFIGSSRYTVLLIETKKRRMTWNTFLSLVLLFDKNQETAGLLRALDIYTDDLDRMLRREEEKTE